ncbi:MAG TPA: hypothetical protein VHA75_09605 [Rugosimonospora sp.]|nr:hypothetical protein [Rugosimonospora sp.]
MSLLRADTSAPARPGSGAPVPDDRILYLRSYLLMRAVIGFLGIALPIALLLGDGFLFKGVRPARGSLSAYYYSGMRDIFVGSLCVIGVFLVTYKVFERDLNNVLTVVAGLAAIGVALFSTSRPPGMTTPLTPLQKLLGEPAVSHVHYVCATLFLGSLGVISIFFGLQEGRRPPRPGHRSPLFWRRFHWCCAGVIAAAGAFIAVSMLTGWLAGYCLIIGETAADLAFGLSWLFKGLELDILLGPTPPAATAVPPAARRSPADEAVVDEAAGSA